MEERKRIWEAEFLCKQIVLEMVEETRKMATKRMVQELILMMVDNASGVVEEVKELVLEMVEAAEHEGMFLAMAKEIQQRNLEHRMVNYLTREIRMRKKELMEKAWKSRMTLSTPEVVEDDPMDWEELELDSWMAYLGLKDSDKVEDMEVELEEEEDWLDMWMKDDLESGQEEHREITRELCRLSLDEQMDIVEMEVETETDYMVWLLKELKEVGIGEDVMECIRTMACEGDCQDKCVVETEVDECVRSVHCDGDCHCQDTSFVETVRIEDIGYGSSMQPIVGSANAEDKHCVRCPGLCRGACSGNNVVVKFMSEDITENSQKTESDNMTIISKTVCTEDNTSGPVQGPACVDRSGWKSSQAVHTGGVSGPGGATPLVQAGLHLDWSKWTEAVHISPEWPSIYDVTGIKYCPGENLPTYQYMEYKPRCSSTRSTTFMYVPDVGTRPKSVTTKPEEMEVGIDVNRLEETRGTAIADTEFTSVKEMVEEWDKKFTLEDQVDTVNQEGARMDRRTSDRFKRLTMCFERSEQGVVGVSEEAEILESKVEVTDKPTYPATILNFSDVCSKFNISIPRKQKLCVVRREGSSLARISTNEKRVRDGECESYLPVSLNWKKMKVSPMDRE